jgi:predicted permease
MIEQLLTPALIFSNFVLNLDTLDIFSWLPVFICTALIISIQMAIGFLSNRLFIRDRFYEPMIVVGNGLVNTTGI